ncbi:hypothetical protein DN745_12950 [Bradymonas sediminis]|uniref:Uncharacterized protein n=1 Tax=Bradymonas sediminis TaxID=1548548 RepID=A0A2Z4FMJ1_9DELT|nr:hypothetical protein DN745_12950 [Bradymonas sediminis]
MALVVFSAAQLLASGCLGDSRACQSAQDCFLGESCVDQTCESPRVTAPDSGEAPDATSTPDGGDSRDAHGSTDPDASEPGPPDGCGFAGAPPRCQPSGTSSDYSLTSPTQLPQTNLGCVDHEELSAFATFRTDARTLCAGEDPHYMRQRFWRCKNYDFQVKVTLETESNCNNDQFDLELYCNSNQELICGDSNPICTVSGSTCSAQDGSISKIVTVHKVSHATYGDLKIGVTRGDFEQTPDAKIQFDYTVTVEQY